jgi:hypothetical protein
MLDRGRHRQNHRLNLAQIVSCGFGFGVKIDKPPEGLGGRTRPGARARSGRIVFTRLDARKPFGVAGGDAICGSSTSPKDCFIPAVNSSLKLA